MAMLYETQETAAVAERMGNGMSYIDAWYSSDVQQFHNTGAQAWSAYSRLVAAENDLGNAEKNRDTARKIVETGWNGGDDRNSGRTGSSSTSNSETDKLLLQYEKDLANEKALYELLKARGESADVLDRQIKVIQDKLNQRAESRETPCAGP